MTRATKTTDGEATSSAKASVQVAIRVEPATLERADVLAERLAALAPGGLQAFDVTRTSVLRAAIVEGLTVMEAKLAEASPREPAPKRTTGGRAR